MNEDQVRMTSDVPVLACGCAARSFLFIWSSEGVRNHEEPPSCYEDDFIPWKRPPFARVHRAEAPRGDHNRSPRAIFAETDKERFLGMVAERVQDRPVGEEEVKLIARPYWAKRFLIPFFIPG